MARQRLNLMTDDRLREGYVIILPGIEGRSYFNRSIARGLAAAGIPYAIEIYDWTLGFLLAVYTLKATQHQQRQAQAIREKILQYRAQHPDRPVYLVGHSGGGAMVLLTLAGLPQGVRVSGGVLINAAISPHYDVTAALSHTTEGLWNFSSWGDLLFLGIGTVVLGTVDGPRGLAAGVRGFSAQVHRQLEGAGLPPLRELRYRWEYLKWRHLGGHFGATAPRFVEHVIAPCLRRGESGASGAGGTH